LWSITLEIISSYTPSKSKAIINLMREDVLFTQPNIIASKYFMKRTRRQPKTLLPFSLAYCSLVNIFQVQDRSSGQV